MSFSAWCQRIDNFASQRAIGSAKYLRFHYENDYFSETDYYYTQGMMLEVAHPVLAKFPSSNVLWHPSSFETKYGVAIEHEGYTATSISHDEVLSNDRPFAACLFLKFFAISSDYSRRRRLVTSLVVGMIGPVAGGEKIQKSIHSWDWINGLSPKGWTHQIQNDLLLNYQLEYEKEVFSIKNVFSLAGKVGGRLGTLSDKVYGGVLVRLGLFDDPYLNLSKQKRSFQVYLYSESLINGVGYDATLQGGVFNPNNDYTISVDRLKRAVFQQNSGLVLKISRFNIEYFQSFLTKEFTEGTSHHWGGLRLGYWF